MAKSFAFAKFQNLLVMLRNDKSIVHIEGCDEILSYVAEETASNKNVRITDIVRLIQFGTGPTVQRKITQLVENELLTVRPSESDGRAKVLNLTVKGERYLHERSKLMLKAIGETK